MKIKVVIIQGYNTPYRNELFNIISDYEDIDLTLLYISQKGLNKKWQDKLDVRFKEIQIKCKVRLASYEDRNTKLNYFDFIKKVIRLNPDVIISSLSKKTILLNYALLWKKVRLIHWNEATIVTEGGNNWFKKPYLKWHINMPRAFLFPGRLAKEYHEYCGFNFNENVFYAPNSVDAMFSISEEDLKAKLSSIKPLKFLFIGSFVERKGFHIINGVYERLKKSSYNFEMHVAGDGPIRPVEGIINHGFLRKEETAALYKDSHVFIMPSQFDCNPLSLIEAAKGGNVLLASKGVGNHPELVAGNGYVHEIEDENELYNQCRKILTFNSSELYKMGKKSTLLANGISHGNTAESFYKAIKYVVKQGRPDKYSQNQKK